MYEKEDDKQYLALLRLLRPSLTDKDFAKICERREAKNDKTLLATIEYCKRKAEFDPARGSLAAILVPENSKLGSVPVFKRYVAYLITEMGCAKAANHLGVSRTTLWRYLYGLDSSGRSGPE